MGTRDDSPRVEDIYNYQKEHSSVPSRDGFLNRISIALSQVFQPVYNSLFAGRGSFITRLEIKLAQARINQAVEIWVTRAIAIGFLLGSLVGAIVGFSISLTLISVSDIVSNGILPTGVLPDAFSAENLPSDALWFGLLFLIIKGVMNGLFTLLWALPFGAIGALCGLAYAIYRPGYEIYQRKQSIDTVMPDVVGFMYSLSIGGTDTLDIFRAVAESDDTYGEAALEFRELVHKIDNLNKDYQTAIRETAATAPNEKLSQFLIDMLSIINSGGNLDQFLESKKEEQMAERKKAHEQTLDTLEFFGEVYITLTIFPLLMLVVLVMMALFGDAQGRLLVLTVYGLIPILNLGYLVSVATITPDPVGNGRLDPPEKSNRTLPSESGLLDLSIVSSHARRSDNPVFGKIWALEFQHQLNTIFDDPIETLTKSPSYSLLFSVPATIVVVGLLFVQGIAEPSLDSFTEEPLMQSFAWFGIPFLLPATIFVMFYEKNRREIGSITNTLTDDLRKMANQNSAGMPLLESLRMTGRDNPSRLGQELSTMYKRVQFGSTVGGALIEFNNKYGIPRLARTVKLVYKSQESSAYIPEVLQTAANLSQIEDDLAEDKKTRSRMQVAIVILGFLVFLGVLIMMDRFFLTTISGLVAESDASQGQFADFGNTSEGFLSMLYIHMTLIQAMFGGLVAGYMREDELLGGIKYSIAFVIVVFVSWAAAYAFF